MLFGNVVYAAGTDAAPKAGMLNTVVIVVLWIAIIYFLMIRPNKNRQKKQDELINSLKKGDTVITRSGIKGKILGEDGDFFEIEVDKNVKLNILKSFVSSIYNK